MKNKKFLTSLAALAAAVGTTDAISNIVSDDVKDNNSIDVKSTDAKQKISGFTIKKNDYKETLSYHSSHRSHLSHTSGYR